MIRKANLPDRITFARPEQRSLPALLVGRISVAKERSLPQQRSQPVGCVQEQGWIERRDSQEIEGSLEAPDGCLGISEVLNSSTKICSCLLDPYRLFAFNRLYFNIYVSFSTTQQCNTSGHSWFHLWKAWCWADWVHGPSQYHDI
jgi:hypothetical protein